MFGFKNTNAVLDDIDITSHFKLVQPTYRQFTRFQEVPRYQEGLYDLGNNVYAWLVPNGAWGESNAGLITGHRGSILIDTLWDVPFTQDMLTAMQTYTANAPITRIINTHADGDHFFGNSLLPHAECIASEAAVAEMQQTQPQAMLLFKRLGHWLSRLPFKEAQQSGYYFQALCAPYAFESVQHQPASPSISGSTTLHLNAREIRVISLGEAHTRGDAMIYLPDNHVLFAGDILFIGVTPVMWAGPFDHVLRAIDQILTLDARIIVPGHGPLTTKAGVRQVRDYWTWLFAQVSERFERGISPRAAAAEIALSPEFQQHPWSTWSCPERILTNTHVMYRHLNGNRTPLNTLGKIRVLYQQAILAHQLAAMTPACMVKHTAEDGR